MPDENKDGPQHPPPPPSDENRDDHQKTASEVQAHSPSTNRDLLLPSSESEEGDARSIRRRSSFSERIVNAKPATVDEGEAVLARIRANKANRESRKRVKSGTAPGGGEGSGSAGITVESGEGEGEGGLGRSGIDGEEDIILYTGHRSAYPSPAHPPSPYTAPTTAGRDSAYSNNTPRDQGAGSRLTSLTLAAGADPSVEEGFELSKPGPLMEEVGSQRQGNEARNPPDVEVSSSSGGSLPFRVHSASPGADQQRAQEDSSSNPPDRYATSRAILPHFLEPAQEGPRLYPTRRHTSVPTEPSDLDAIYGVVRTNSTGTVVEKDVMDLLAEHGYTDEAAADQRKRIQEQVNERAEKERILQDAWAMSAFEGGRSAAAGVAGERRSGTAYPTSSGDAGHLAFTRKGRVEQSKDRSGNTFIDSSFDLSPIEERSERSTFTPTIAGTPSVRSVGISGSTDTLVQPPPAPSPFKSTSPFGSARPGGGRGPSSPRVRSPDKTSNPSRPGSPSKKMSPELLRKAAIFDSSLQNQQRTMPLFGNRGTDGNGQPSPAKSQGSARTPLPSNHDGVRTPNEADPSSTSTSIPITSNTPKGRKTLESEELRLLSKSAPEKGGWTTGNEKGKERAFDEGNSPAVFPLFSDRDRHQFPDKSPFAAPKESERKDLFDWNRRKGGGLVIGTQANEFAGTSRQDRAGDGKQKGTAASILPSSGIPEIPTPESTPRVGLDRLNSGFDAAYIFAEGKLFYWDRRLQYHPEPRWILCSAILNADRCCLVLHPTTRTREGLLIAARTIPLNECRSAAKVKAVRPGITDRFANGEVFFFDLIWESNIEMLAAADERALTHWIHSVRRLVASERGDDLDLHSSSAAEDDSETLSSERYPVAAPESGPQNRPGNIQQQLAQRETQETRRDPSMFLGVHDPKPMRDDSSILTEDIRDLREHLDKVLRDDTPPPPARDQTTAHQFQQKHIDFLALSDVMGQHSQNTSASASRRYPSDGDRLGTRHQSETPPSRGRSPVRGQAPHPGQGFHPDRRLSPAPSSNFDAQSQTVPFSIDGEAKDNQAFRAQTESVPQADFGEKPLPRMPEVEREIKTLGDMDKWTDQKQLWQKPPAQLSDAEMKRIDMTSEAILKRLQKYDSVAVAQNARISQHLREAQAVLRRLSAELKGVVEDRGADRPTLGEKVDFALKLCHQLLEGQKRPESSLGQHIGQASALRNSVADRIEFLASGVLANLDNPGGSRASSVRDFGSVAGDVPGSSRVRGPGMFSKFFPKSGREQSLNGDSEHGLDVHAQRIAEQRARAARRLEGVTSSPSLFKQEVARPETKRSSPHVHWEQPKVQSRWSDSTGVRASESPDRTTGQDFQSGTAPDLRDTPASSLPASVTTRPVPVPTGAANRSVDTESRAPSASYDSAALQQILSLLQKQMEDNAFANRRQDDVVRYLIELHTYLQREQENRSAADRATAQSIAEVNYHLVKLTRMTARQHNQNIPTGLGLESRLNAIARGADIRNDELAGDSGIEDGDSEDEEDDENGIEEKDHVKKEQGEGSPIEGPASVGARKEPKLPAKIRKPSRTTSFRLRIPSSTKMAAKVFGVPLNRDPNRPGWREATARPMKRVDDKPHETPAPPPESARATSESGETAATPSDELGQTEAASDGQIDKDDAKSVHDEAEESEEEGRSMLLVQDERTAQQSATIAAGVASILKMLREKDENEAQRQKAEEDRKQAKAAAKDELERKREELLHLQREHTDVVMNNLHQKIDEVADVVRQNKEESDQVLSQIASNTASEQRDHAEARSAELATMLLHLKEEVERQVDDSKKYLNGEVQYALNDVKKLLEQKKRLEVEIAELFDFKSKHSPKKTTAQPTPSAGIRSPPSVAPPPPQAPNPPVQPKRLQPAPVRPRNLARQPAAPPPPSEAGTQVTRPTQPFSVPAWRRGVNSAYASTLSAPINSSGTTTTGTGQTPQTPATSVPSSWGGRGPRSPKG